VAEVSAGPDAPAVEMRGISKSFGATPALAGVDFAVRHGEVCALVGQNGAGKSTLMAILVGSLKADAGDMRLDGSPFAPRTPLDARRAGIAMIHQELSLALDLSVMENITLGAEPARFGLVNRRAMREIAAAALAELGHPEVAPDRRARTLSIGARQIVEIARAIASGCRVLVLDEPTSSLDREDAGRLFALIRRLRAQGHAVVYISHFIEEVQAIADRFVVLRDGRNAGGGADANHAAIVGMMVGRAVGDLYPRTARARGEALLAVDLTAGDAGFTIHRGEIVGIAGLVGAGRTRLLRSIFGLAAVRRGEVTVSAGAASPAERWRAGVGYVSEDRKGEGLALGLSIADNVTLTRLEPFGRAGLVARRPQRETTEHWLARMDVRRARPTQPASQLSGGNQQKLALARLLHHDVDVLILDEPTRGIDVGSKAEIYALLDRLVADRPGRRAKAALVVSSYVPELLGLCDRIAVMCRGRLGPFRLTADWTEHELMMAATGSTRIQ
jgi:ribose transport system ATP-binding protein